MKIIIYETEFTPLNFTTKTGINSKYGLDKSFQEILYRIDNCINEGSGWIVKSINAEYINISVYCPLPGSTYIELLSLRLKKSMKRLLISETTTIDAFFGVISDI